mgnify:CR=1 FL=1
MLTDVIMCTYELIDKCTKEIEKEDKQMRDQALALIIKEAKKSVFDGWTDWRYDLLKSGACVMKRVQRSLKRFWIPFWKFHGRIITRNIRKKKI